MGLAKTKRLEVIVKHVIIIAIGMVMLYPLLWLLISSFKPDNEIFGTLSLWSDNFTFENYINGWRGLSGVTFGRFMINTFFIVGMSILGNVISGSLTAFAFARLDFRFKAIGFTIVLLTLMLPFHVTVIPSYVIWNELGLVNTYWPLIFPKFFAVEGFFIYLMIQFMRGIPRSIDESAFMDGASPLTLYARIILPLSLPAIVSTVIFSFIWTWNDFFSQLLYLSDINRYTVALGLRMFLDSSGASNWGQMFAMSIVTLIPIFVVFIFFQRYLIEGITAGGIKG
jgi:multiple sugar transport system permease protein